MFSGKWPTWAKPSRHTLPPPERLYNKVQRGKCHVPITESTTVAMLIETYNRYRCTPRNQMSSAVLPVCSIVCVSACVERSDCAFVSCTHTPNTNTTPNMNTQHTRNRHAEGMDYRPAPFTPSVVDRSHFGVPRTPEEVEVARSAGVAVGAWCAIDNDINGETCYDAAVDGPDDDDTYVPPPSTHTTHTTQDEVEREQHLRSQLLACQQARDVGQLLVAGRLVKRHVQLAPQPAVQPFDRELPPDTVPLSVLPVSNTVNTALGSFQLDTGNTDSTNTSIHNIDASTRNTDTLEASSVPAPVVFSVSTVCQSSTGVQPVMCSVSSVSACAASSLPSPAYDTKEVVIPVSPDGKKIWNCIDLPPGLYALKPDPEFWGGYLTVQYGRKVRRKHVTWILDESKEYGLPHFVAPRTPRSVYRKSVVLSERYLVFDKRGYGGVHRAFDKVPVMEGLFCDPVPSTIVDSFVEQAGIAAFEPVRESDEVDGGVSETPCTTTTTTTTTTTAAAELRTCCPNLDTPPPSDGEEEWCLSGDNGAEEVVGECAEHISPVSPGQAPKRRARLGAKQRKRARVRAAKAGPSQ